MKIEEHLEHIDAHVFTGDQLHDVEMRAKFQWYLDRWQREMRALDNDIVDQLTEQFVTVLKEWTTPEDFAEMQRLNAAETNPSICHSHDFCDANMAMYEAFTTLGFTATCDVEAVESSEYAASQALWNAAWLIAFKADFSPIMCSANLAEVK